MELLLNKLKEFLTNPSVLGFSIALIGGYVAYRCVFSTSRSTLNKGDWHTLKDPRATHQLEVIEKVSLTHDVIRLRVALPSPQHSLGIELGHHIKLSARVNGENVNRPYTPTSSIDDRGFFDLVLKVKLICY